MTAPDWRAAWERERAALSDDERGLLWTLRWAVVACAVVVTTAGALALVNGCSRAVARWEVAQ
jgi:hypothetical protein